MSQAIERGTDREHNNDFRMNQVSESFSDYSEYPVEKSVFHC